MDKTARKKVSRAATFVVKAGETRPSKVIGRLNGKVTVPTQSDRRANKALFRLKQG